MLRHLIDPGRPIGHARGALAPCARRALEGLATLAVLGLVGSSGLALAAPNPPLQNPGFEVVGPAGFQTVNAPPAPGGAGQSAAEGWGVFHNTVPAGGSTTTTELVPTTLPGSPGGRMIRVSTQHGSNGLVQVTGPFFSGTPQALGSGWVYVVNGVVGLGTGNGGNTGIDMTTTTTGAWEYLQAPNGQSPANEILFYAVGGPATFYVDDAGLDPIQEPSTVRGLEYSNLPDEQSVPGGGDHAGPDPGQTLYTEIVDGATDRFPIDARDFFPGIEDGEEPDAQIDALANARDHGFAELLDDRLDLAFSAAGDLGPFEPIAAWTERTSGVADVLFTHRDLHALNVFGDLDDVDAMELWGRATGDDPMHVDATHYSLAGDVTGVSIWTGPPAAPSPYLSRAFVHSRLAVLGFQGTLEQVDVDALMIQDTNGEGVFDAGDAVLLSIRAAANFDGGEIVHLPFGAPPSFLVHGGHVWDTAFDVQAVFRTGTEEIDALEVPEPGLLAGLAGGGLALLGLSRARRGRGEAPDHAAA